MICLHADTIINLHCLMGKQSGLAIPCLLFLPRKKKIRKDFAAPAFSADPPPLVPSSGLSSSLVALRYQRITLIASHVKVLVQGGFIKGSLFIFENRWGADLTAAWHRSSLSASPSSFSLTRRLAKCAVESYLDRAFVSANFPFMLNVWVVVWSSGDTCKHVKRSAWIYCSFWNTLGFFLRFSLSSTIKI